MSRAGYSEDLDNWQLIRWRGQVASAIRGKRGQAFFKALVEALDGMPEKELVSGDLQDDSGCMCTLGALAKHKGLNLDQLDTYDYDDLGQQFGIAYQLAQEVMYENDEGSTCHLIGGAWVRETPELRWQRMRNWAVSHLSDSERNTVHGEQTTVGSRT